MGYQVGSQCFSTLSQAENHYFSLVVPSVTSDGRLIKPHYQGGQWLFNDQIIHAVLPECDQAQQFADGVQLGFMVFGVMASLFVFSLIYKLLR